MNSIGGLSNKGFSEMVQWFDIRRVVINSDSEGCPINYIGGLPNELYRRVV